MRRLCVLVLLLAAGAVVAAIPAAADPPATGDWEYHLEGPNTAGASNGETITLTGSGHFSVHRNESGTGGGTFSHATPGEPTIDGTWTQTGFVMFVLYGCGFLGDPDLCGGRAILNVEFTPTGTTLKIPGKLTVTCLIGDPPAGADEGIRVVVPSIANFNKEVSGENVFIRD